MAIERQAKVKFDEYNPEHIGIFKKFCETGSWNGLCPFLCDASFMSVPHMIQAKITNRFLREFTDEATGK